MKHYDNKGNHFFVEIIPSIDDKGHWDGRYQLAIQVRKSNIDDDSFYALEQLCQMTCASITMMEENHTIKDVIYNFLNTPENEEINTPLPIDSVDENVIKVNFKREIVRSTDNKC